MSDRAKIEIYALFVDIAAMAFILAETRLFVHIRRVSGDRSIGEPAPFRGRRLAYLVSLFVLSVLSFPATTLCLVTSFVAPWQLLWPAALVFLLNGIGGIMACGWLLAGPRRKMVAVAVSAIPAFVLSFLALSIFLVRHR